ncbi:MAG: hypothetical protein ACK52J_04290 [bacterium]
MIRNVYNSIKVAVVGHLHHGKTCLVDMFVAETHPNLIKFDEDLRYTDTRYDE